MQCGGEVKGAYIQWVPRNVMNDESKESNTKEGKRKKGRKQTINGKYALWTRICET